jgi:hypothetical protein
LRSFQCLEPSFGVAYCTTKRVSSLMIVHFILKSALLSLMYHFALSSRFSLYQFCLDIFRGCVVFFTFLGLDSYVFWNSTLTNLSFYLFLLNLGLVNEINVHENERKKERSMAYVDDCWCWKPDQLKSCFLMIFIIGKSGISPQTVFFVIEKKEKLAGKHRKPENRKTHCLLKPKPVVS